MIKQNKGVGVLLVMVIFTAITSISFTMFYPVLTQLTISSELGGSFDALYAADEGAEKMLYLDFNKDPNLGLDLCNGGLGSGCYTTSETAFNLRACYNVRVNKFMVGSDRATSLVVSGEYPCGSDRLVRRAFEYSYTYIPP